MSDNFSLFLASSGFEHRATRVPGRGVVYRLRDRSGHVALPALEWDRLQQRLAEETKPVNRRTNWLFAGLIPGIFLFGLTLGQILPFGGIVILVGLFFGPGAIYLWRARRIEQIARGIEAELARWPKAGPPPPVPGRTPRWMRIALFLLVGPELVLQIWGTLNPQAYAGSPWAGMHLEVPGIAGLVLLGVYQYRRWRRGRAAEAELRAALAVGRRADFVARAREE